VFSKASTSFDCTMRGSLSAHCDLDRYWISEEPTRTRIWLLSSALSAVGCGISTCLFLTVGPLPSGLTETSNVSFVAVPHPLINSATSGRATTAFFAADQR
jgi:hypothetical protein